MRFSHPQIRKTARRIPLLCALYYVLFSFSYLYFFQSELMAQSQFLLSEGITEYHPKLASLLCTLLLLMLGFFLDRLFQWLPLRMKASAWYPSFLLLGVLTSLRFPEFGDRGEAPSWFGWTLLVAFFALLLLLGRMFVDSSKERDTLSTYAWPNAILLVFFSSITLSVGNTDAVLHHTLRSANLLSRGKTEQVLEEARLEQCPSRQLSVLTALALSREERLGDELFTFPLPYGIDGLLPQLSDTLMFFNLPAAVEEQMGYRKSERTPTMLFFRLINQKPDRRPAARHYQLSALLLRRQLMAFSETLLQSDSLSSMLPLHYQEAWVLYQHLSTQPLDSLPTPDLYERFDEFVALYENPSCDDRQLKVHEQFGGTYWNFYYYGDDLQNKK